MCTESYWCIRTTVCHLATGDSGELLGLCFSIGPSPSSLEQPSIVDSDIYTVLKAQIGHTLVDRTVVVHMSTELKLLLTIVGIILKGLSLTVECDNVHEKMTK